MSAESSSTTTFSLGQIDQAIANEYMKKNFKQPPPTQPLVPSLSESTRKRRIEFVIPSGGEDNDEIQAIHEELDDNFLYKEARLPIRKSRLQRMYTWLLVVAHCERVIANRAPVSFTDGESMQLLFHVYDDFALDRRPPVASMLASGFSRDEQLALFVVRARLAFAIATVMPQCRNAAELLVPVQNRDKMDYYWRCAAGNDASDEIMNEWLAKTGAGHPLLQNNVLTLRSASVQLLWDSILHLQTAWPTLAMCAPLVRFFEEIRMRIAFFLSYREISQSFYDLEGNEITFEQRVRELQGELLGFNLGVFGGVDLFSSQANPGLIDKTEFIAISDAQETDGCSYAHVNAEFLDECERMIHAMHSSLRCQMGLQREGSPSCVACKYTPDEMVGAEAALHRVDQFLGAAHQKYVQDKFREQAFSMYALPGEAEHHAEFHMHEAQIAAAFIADRRREDFLALQAMIMDMSVSDAWSTKLRNDRNDPAHALVASLVLHYDLQEKCGGSLVSYYHTLAELGPHCESVSKRKLAEELYDQTNTGTLHYYHKFLQERGPSAPPHHRRYEHPLILRGMNTFYVYYKRHVHEFTSFGEAFLCWLWTMCFDKHICGCMNAQVLMLDYAEPFFPYAWDEFQAQKKEVAEKVSEWARIDGIVPTNLSRPPATIDGTQF